MVKAAILKSCFLKVSRDRKGSVIVIVAISLILFLGLGALAIDVGYLYTTRAELQNVADAAALAGARYLGEIYASSSDPSTENIDEEEVYSGAIEEVAKANKAAKVSIDIAIADIEVGIWDPVISTDDLTKTTKGPNAVSVIARRTGADGGLNGAVALFFANAFGIDTADVSSKKAIAALTGPSSVANLKTPFAFSENMFPDCCKTSVTFSPTTDSCASWHNFLTQ